ncbi:restriction endonuclease subunit S [Lacinutrix undariae]
MEKYNEYKDSGVAWLNQIPKNWQFRRVKDLTKIISKGTTPSTEGEAYTNTGVRFVKAQNVNSNGKVVSKPFFFISKETNEILKRSQLEANDLLLVIAGATTGKIAVIEESQLPANTNQAVCFLRLKNEEKKESLRYKYYYINSSCFQSLIWLYAVTSAQPNLPMAILGRIDFCYPPLKEQTQIANYLDAKTIAIDKKVNLLQQKIKHYKAYRKTLINETVTKGIDKTVKLKDSGIDWIGEIPKHWEVKRLKDLSKFINGYAFNSKEYIDKGVPIIRISNISNDMDFEKCRYVDSKYLKLAKDALIVENDILVAMTGATIGKNSIYNSERKALLNQRVGIIRTKKSINNLFLFQIIKSQIFKDYIDLLCGGSAQENISKTQIENFYIQLPPIKEQQQIADYLDTKTSNIDKIVKNIETQIITLKELRKTLINEVVTGKVKVSA